MKNCTSRQRRAGFSLIELLVVMAIIALLAGVTIATGRAVTEHGRSIQTETTLTHLETAFIEWEQSADRKLTWLGVHDNQALADRYDVHWDTPDILVITEMLATIRRVKGVENILVNIDPDLIYTYQSSIYPEWISGFVEQYEIDSTMDGEITVLDAWGTPIYATHPGRPWKTADGFSYGNADPDGTIRTPNETRYGVARSQRICFVSAGPDRNFGYVNAAPGSLLHEATLDNIYSYEPDLTD